MKTPEEIKKGLEACMAGECRSQRHECPYRKEAECTMALSQDALAYIQQIETRLVEANKTSDDLRAKLAEHEKPLVPMKLEEVLEKSKNVSDNVIWLESPDEEDPNETDCLPALVSNLASFRANRIGIEYARFLMWPDEHVLFPVTNGTEYGKRWRCWPRKPTDEERKAAKWDG